jgi:hypothetical protein
MLLRREDVVGHLTGRGQRLDESVPGGGGEGDDGAGQPSGGEDRDALGLADLENLERLAIGGPEIEQEPGGVPGTPYLAAWL